MNKEYRIAEYINGFIVEFNYSYYDYSFWGKKIKKTFWIPIDKKGQPLNKVKKHGTFMFYKYESFEESKYKTKKEALKAIEDFKKYPIYHKV